MIRLNKEELEIIKKLSREIFGDCDVYIFGSRLKKKMGGDIDIFINPVNRQNLFEKKIKLSAKLEDILGKPVDVVIQRDRNRPIEKEAIRGIKI